VLNYTDPSSSSSSSSPAATTLSVFLPALQFPSMLLYPQPSYSNSESQFSHIRSDVTFCPLILLTAIGLRFVILYPFSQNAPSLLWPARTIDTVQTPTIRPSVPELKQGQSSATSACVWQRVDPGHSQYGANIKGVVMLRRTALSAANGNDVLQLQEEATLSCLLHTLSLLLCPR